LWKSPSKAAKHSTKKNGMQIPLYWHLAAEFCLIGGCFLGNLALDLKLPLPLFFLIKCGNLVASMVVGSLFLKRNYSYDQVMSVILVTGGLVHSTITTHGGSMGDRDLASWSIFLGAFSVFLALISTSFLGAVQETMFSKYREHFDEITFVSTFLFIPLYFLLNMSSITQHSLFWMKGGWLKVIVPLVVNAVASHICRLSM
jgi:solute carrier family 35 (UDP-xylose/UDP-N-acetylglucosamine transporter), member B4